MPLGQVLDSNVILQDKNDYIWVAGVHGLIRYDGHENLKFSKHSKEWPIPYTWINHISAHNDMFLVATETQGAWIFNPINGESHKLPINTINSSIYNILHHKNHYYLYSPSPHRLYKYSLQDKSTQVIAKDIEIKFLANTEKYIYFASDNNFYRVEEGTVNKVIETPITSITTLQNNVFVASNNTIWSYHDSGKLSSLTLPEKIISIGSSFNKQSFFAILESGAIYEFSAKNLTSIESHYQTIQYDSINDVYQDNNGVIWISYDRGVQRATKKTYKTHDYSYQTRKLRSLYLHTTPLDNTLLVGTTGLGLYDFNNVKNLLPENINDQFSARGLKIMDLLTHNKTVYIATFDGLWEFNLLSQELNRINIFAEDTILLSLKIHKDKLYIGSDDQGIVIYDLITQNVIKKIDKNDGLSSAEVIDILPLGSNKLWIATSKGIDTYNRLSNKISQIENPGTSKVYSLAYADNKIFAATQSDGILVYNQQGILLSQFGQSIAFHSVKNIDGEIWAPSSHGLYKINPQSHHISLIPNTEDYKFTDAPIKLKNKVFIPHYQGILEIPLENEKTINSKVYISKTSISGKPYLQNKSIKLNSTNDVVLLELASLDYRLGQKKQFQYQINSRAWNQVSGNQLSIAGLTPGTYRISIKGTNSLGEWSENQAFTEINLAFPWYWTPQIRIAYIVIILFLSFITCWLIFLRFISIKNIHTLLSEDLTFRGKSSLNISKSLSRVIEILNHKHETPSPNIFKIKQHNEEACSIIQECIEELSSHSKTQEPNALYGKNLSVALPYFVDFMHSKYHIMLAMNYEIEDEMLEYEMQSDIYKIIYEAIIAAVLKGSNGKFSVSVQEFKQKIWLTINDEANSFSNYNNKINFDMSMYLIRQIAKKYKASVNTFNDKQQGSQLLISLPLIKIS